MSKTKKGDDDLFDPAEGRRRFEAALRGARDAGHKPMSDLSPRRATAKPKKKAAKKRS